MHNASPCVCYLKKVNFTDASETRPNVDNVVIN